MMAKKYQLANNYQLRGWELISEVIPKSQIDAIKENALPMRHKSHEFSKWDGISCAGRFNGDLMEFYTSDAMRSVAESILGSKTYLFNDQVVYKLPHDGMTFEAHFDNQYGTNIDGSIHTVNLSVVLDDFTPWNGTLSLQNEDDGEWVTVYPKAGDIIAIRGSTLHKSTENISMSPRGLYACVYTESPMNMTGFYNTLFEKVIRKCNVIR
jgi:hypothetical protein